MGLEVVDVSGVAVGALVDVVDVVELDEGVGVGDDVLEGTIEETELGEHCSGGIPAGSDRPAT